MGAVDPDTDFASEAGTGSRCSRRVPMGGAPHSVYLWVPSPMVAERELRHAVVVSLFWRVVAINAGGLVVAALLLALSPATVSSNLTLGEAIVLAVGTVALIGVNVALLRRVFDPLERLAALMRRIDPLEHGLRIKMERPVAEVADVYRAFNAMLDRLEQERRGSGRRALMAQEAERRRIARELHDDVGQTLTGVVLQLEGLQRATPPALAEQLELVQESAREGVEKVREIARGLRPQALDEFGLRSALVTLAAGFSDRSSLKVRHRVGRQLPPLAPEQDLAIYRVAQESLTNIVRHANAQTVDLELENVDGTVVLAIRDDGRGISDAEVAGSGTGLAGMRERAMLVGGRLSVERRPEGGTEVRLEVPA
jgi:two-component system, NarL family, sensor histidine kinase UhpB